MSCETIDYAGMDISREFSLEDDNKVLENLDLIDITVVVRHGTNKIMTFVKDPVVVGQTALERISATRYKYTIPAVISRTLSGRSLVADYKYERSGKTPHIDSAPITTVLRSNLVK